MAVAEIYLNRTKLWSSTEVSHRSQNYTRSGQSCKGCYTSRHLCNDLRLRQQFKVPMGVLLSRAKINVNFRNWNMHAILIFRYRMIQNYAEVLIPKSYSVIVLHFRSVVLRLFPFQKRYESTYLYTWIITFYSMQKSMRRISTSKTGWLGLDSSFIKTPEP